MRSFARCAAAALVVAVLLPALHAQSSQPERLYKEALEREAALRREMEGLRPGTSFESVLERVRVLVTSYRDLSRLFPESGYSDNALWQGAALSSAAFWQFGDAQDRETALTLLEDLTARFPTSSLVKQVPREAKRLEAAAAKGAAGSASTSAAPAIAPDAPAAPRAAVPSGVPDAAAARPGRSPAPAPAAPTVRAPAAARSATVPATPPATAADPALLRSIRREVLPDALRFTLELDREVPFYHEPLEAPPRIFIDLRNTAAVRALRGATIPFQDDVVTQVRVGLHLDARTRVVLDVTGTRRYSVYPLYNPFRVVVDIERASAAARPAPGAFAARSAVPALARPAPAAPPAPAAANRDGTFSLSRQLGLGIARIVIDPGHGGQDPGAKARGVTEAALVLDIALRLEKLLLKEPGVEVVLTRRTDTYISLEERTALANRAGADLFLSIHLNASRNAAARGIETYVLNFAASTEAEAVAARENAGSGGQMRQLPDIVKAIALNNKIDESRDFAAMIQSALYERVRKIDRGTKNLGVKQAPFVVLIGATMPSVLAEVSFVTNRQEADLLKTEKYRQQVAEALFSGVMAYQQSLEKATAVATN